MKLIRHSIQFCVVVIVIVCFCMILAMPMTANQEIKETTNQRVRTYPSGGDEQVVDKFVKFYGSGIFVADPTFGSYKNFPFGIPRLPAQLSSAYPSQAYPSQQFGSHNPI